MELDHKEELKAAAWKVRIVLDGIWYIEMMVYHRLGSSSRRDICWFDVGLSRRQVLRIVPCNVPF